LNLGVILGVCVGGIVLFQWKQGNTFYKSILKRSLSERSFFLDYSKYILNPEYKNIYAFFKNNAKRHYKLVI